MIEMWLPQASSFAWQIDLLVWVITILVGVCFLAAEGIFFYWIFRYRARDGRKAEYITGEEHDRKKWVHRAHAIVLVFDAAIIVGAVTVWFHIKQELPPAQQTVRVIGQQWAWSFVHPGADGALDTPDDIKTVGELRVAVNTVYHFKLESRDVLHSFSIPAFRLKQDAVPGREITGWFEPIQTGRFDIQCAEICGIGHGIMPASIVVESAEKHAAWVAQHTPATRLAALAGR